MMTEQAALAAIRKHEELRSQVSALGQQKLAIQNKLALKDFNGEGGRRVLIRDAARIEQALQPLKRAAAQAGIERQMADFALRQTTPAPTIAPAPVAPTPAPTFNDAQVQHLRLLATRARDQQLKVSARLAAALDLLAIVEPTFRGAR